MKAIPLMMEIDIKTQQIKLLDTSVGGQFGFEDRIRGQRLSNSYVEERKK